MRSVLLLALLVAVPAWAKPAKAPETVTLAFGWRPGWEAEVTATSVQEQDGERREKPAFRYALGVEAGRDGELLLRTRTLGEPPTPPGMPPEVAEVLRRASATAVAERIGPDASYRGLDDPSFLEGLAAELRAAAEPMVASIEDPAAQAKLRGMFDTMLSTATLENESSGDWNRAVGFWVGAAMELGREYPYAEPMPTMLGTPMPALGHLAAEAWTPCHDGRKAPTCVRLRLHQEVDPAAFGTLLGSMTPVPLPEGTTMTPTSFTSDVVSLVEPSTMRPWRVEVVKATTIQLTHEGRTETSATRSTDTRVWRWR